MHKSVAEPLKQVARRELLHSFVDEYRDKTEDIVLLEGETHSDRPSVSISVTYRYGLVRIDFSLG